MKRPHIVVVGSANIDLTIFTTGFPRAGETIFGRAFQLGFGGKGANQAIAAALCGTQVSMVARVGDDLFGPATIQNFRDRGVATSCVWLTRGISTGVAPIFVDDGGQNRIIVVKGANDALSPADVDAAADVLQTADCVILQLEVPLETVYHTLRFARERGIRTILNPAPAQPLDLKEAANADYLIPNETEAAVLSGTAGHESRAQSLPAQILKDARAAAIGLLRQGMSRVVVTLGANGALLASPDGAEYLAPHRVNSVDTSGAGDAFIGSFASFLARGWAEREAIERANVYAALSTLKAGTQCSFVTLEAFEEIWAAKEELRAPTQPRRPEGMPS